jgi:hypothetical protein
VKESVCQVLVVKFAALTSQPKPHAKNGCAIFGSPTRHPIQDKKTVLTKNGILKITAKKNKNAIVL